MASLIGLVGEGDSLTDGAANHFYQYGGVTASVPPTLLDSPQTNMGRIAWRFPANGMICVNMAIAGSSLLTNSTDLVQRAPTNVDPVIAASPSPLRVTGLTNNRPTRKYILYVWVGHNARTSDYTLFASQVASYCLARRAAGFNAIILATLVSRTNDMMADSETYRQGYNSIIRGSSWQSASGVTAIADYGADPTIGATGACNTGLYLSDHIHPTTDSQTSYIFPIFAAAVNAVKATL